MTGHLQQAQRMLEHGALAEALDALRLGLDADPKCARLQIYHAWAQYLDVRTRTSAPGRPTINGKRLRVLAKQHRLVMQKALFRVPDFVDGYILVGRILLDEKDARRALFSFEKGLRQDPDHAECARWAKLARSQLESVLRANGSRAEPPAA